MLADRILGAMQNNEVPSIVAMPSFLGFLCRQVRRGLRGGDSTFKLGMMLFLLNWPVGWGGGALCALLAAAYKSKFWLLAAGFLYIISWVMLGVATILLGVDAKNRLLAQYKTSRIAFDRLKKHRLAKLKTKD